LLYLQVVQRQNIHSTLQVLAPCSTQGPSLPARNCLGKKIENNLCFKKARPVAYKGRLDKAGVLNRLTLILTNYIYSDKGWGRPKGQS
jgi:hypothetical protein